MKRYVTMYKRWQLWLQEAKRVDPPGRPAELVDYLLVLGDEPCARTVPVSLLKAVSWMEKVAVFKLEIRATGRRLAWAAIEVLSEGAPLTKRAPRYPVACDGLGGHRESGPRWLATFGRDYLLPKRMWWLSRPLSCRERESPR